ncbi:MAG TPA: FeoB-associated Cys-rich membrane protein [Pirellulales bacterium]|jgi:hypothetical protein|nr:FeoB-associated Cys-rich membrane protein [Pirellulales bacterium]
MQNIIALFIVAAAVGYLLRRGWRYFAAKKSAGCASGCGSCASNSKNIPDAKPLVTIDALRSSRPNSHS